MHAFALASAHYLSVVIVVRIIQVQVKDVLNASFLAQILIVVACHPDAQPEQNMSYSSILRKFFYEHMPRRPNKSASNTAHCLERTQKKRERCKKISTQDVGQQIIIGCPGWRDCHDAQ